MPLRGLRPTVRGGHGDKRNHGLYSRPEHIMGSLTQSLPCLRRPRSVSTTSESLSRTSATLNRSCSHSAVGSSSKSPSRGGFAGQYDCGRGGVAARTRRTGGIGHVPYVVSRQPRSGPTPRHARSGRVDGEIDMEPLDKERVYREYHPGALVLYDGDQYEVQEVVEDRINPYRHRRRSNSTRTIPRLDG